MLYVFQRDKFYLSSYNLNTPWYNCCTYVLYGNKMLLSEKNVYLVILLHNFPVLRQITSALCSTLVVYTVYHQQRHILFAKCDSTNIHIHIGRNPLPKWSFYMTVLLSADAAVAWHYWRHHEHYGVSNHWRLDCFSNVCAGIDQIRDQSSASLAFVWRNHRPPVDSPHNGPVLRKIFPFGDVTMGVDPGRCP